MAHKTVMTKDVLECMLDTHCVDENPMVVGCDETWLVAMMHNQCNDDKWTEAALNWVDFDLNVSSELSEERRDDNSEEFLVEEEEEPHIAIPIGLSCCMVVMALFGEWTM